MKTLYQLFSGSNLLNSVVIIIFAIFLLVPSIFSANSMDFQFPENSMPFYNILKVIFEDKILLSVFFSFLIFMLNAFLLSNLNTIYILVLERTFLPSYFYIITLAFFPGLFQLNPFLPASVFILLILHWMFKSYKAEDNSRLFFEAGLFLGVASLFYAPSLYYILFIWFSTAVIRPFFWREWFYPILGILTIFLLTWGFYFIFLGEPLEFFRLLSLNIQPGLIKVRLPVVELSAAVFLLMMIIFSSFYMLNVYQFRKIYARKYFKILFWLFYLSMAFFFFLAGDDFSLFYVAAFPLAYIFTNYFFYGRKLLLKNYLLFTLSFLLAVFVVLNRIFMWF